MALGSLQPDFSSDYLTSRTRAAKRRQPLSETGLWCYLPSRTPWVLQGRFCGTFFRQEELWTTDRTETHRPLGSLKNQQGGTIGAKNQLTYVWSRSRNLKRYKFVYYCNCPHFSSRWAKPRPFHYTAHRESNAQVLAMGTHIKEGEEDTRFVLHLASLVPPFPVLR